MFEKRQSVRSYKQDMPSDKQIMKVVEAGLIAPSFLNVQPWHFVVVKEPSIKNILSKMPQCICIFLQVKVYNLQSVY